MITNQHFQINNFRTFCEQVEGEHCNGVASFIWTELEKQAGRYSGGIWRPRPRSALRKLGKLNKGTVDIHHESCYLMFVFNADSTTCCFKRIVLSILVPVTVSPIKSQALLHCSLAHPEPGSCVTSFKGRAQRAGTEDKQSCSKRSICQQRFHPAYIFSNRLEG